MSINDVDRGDAWPSDSDKATLFPDKRVGALGRAGRVLGKLAALLLVAAAGVWAYYANVASSRPAMDMTMRVGTGNTAFPVFLAPVQRGGMAGSVTYTGSVAPFNEEDIYPRVMGRIVTP